MKFKIGQVIGSKELFKGFEKATIYKIDNKFYHVRIVNGIATIPIKTAEENYTLL